MVLLLEQSLLYVNSMDLASDCWRDMNVRSCALSVSGFLERKAMSALIDLMREIEKIMPGAIYKRTCVYIESVL